MEKVEEKKRAERKRKSNHLATRFLYRRKKRKNEGEEFRRGGKHFHH
jgi:hypothetical protein